MLVMFPGQGSQKIGMGKDIFDESATAREVFQEVDEAISFKLSDLIFNGNETDLKATQNAQPAIMATSIAFFRTLQKDFGFNVAQKAKFFAGHSLGEYSALCAAGVLSLSDTAKILRARGQAMAQAFPSGGAMAAIIGLAPDIVEQIATESSDNERVVQVANDNSVGQIVISGHKEAVQLAIGKAKERGAKMATLLEVSGPFHSKLMEPAVKILSETLAQIHFDEPTNPIISNVTAQAENKNFKTLLEKQITSPVRWRESIIFAQDNGVTTCIEIGPGKVLAGLAKRTVPSLRLVNINSLDTLKNYENLP